MNIMIVGASKGLGRALVEGLCDSGDTIIGISRTEPKELALNTQATVKWIEADMAKPVEAANKIAQQAPNELDAIIYNVGIWEEDAFTDNYNFLTNPDDEIINMVNVNITSTILLLKRLIPTLLKSPKPHIILTGSTSGVSLGGGPEVTFGASKFALKGIADSLRQSFKAQKLAVTCLQLGDLNTDDDLSTPISEACQRENGSLIPVHDVVNITRTILQLSECSYIKEIIMPTIRDPRI